MNTKICHIFIYVFSIILIFSLSGCSNETQVNSDTNDSTVIIDKYDEKTITELIDIKPEWKSENIFPKNDNILTSDETDTRVERTAEYQVNDFDMIKQFYKTYTVNKTSVTENDTDYGFYCDYIDSYVEIIVNVVKTDEKTIVSVILTNESIIKR